MGNKKRGYHAKFSIFFGSISVVAYLLLVFLGVYYSWDNVMRNGEPGILAMQEPDQILLTQMYRWGIVIGCLLFLGLWLAIYFYHWRYGRFIEERNLVRKCARTVRYGGVSAMILLYMTYVRFFFAGDGVSLILAFLQIFLASVTIVMFIKRSLSYRKATRDRRRANRENDLPKPKRYDMSLIASSFTSFFGFIVFLFMIGQFALSLLDVLYSMNVLDSLLRKLLAPPVPYQYFVLRTPYDWYVMLLPLAAILFYWLNVKYNAPPIVGDPPSFRARAFKDAYFMVHYPKESHEEES